MKLLVFATRQFAALASGNPLTPKSHDSIDEFETVAEFAKYIAVRERHNASLVPSDLDMELTEFLLFDHRDKRQGTLLNGQSVVELCSVDTIERSYRHAEPGPLTELSLHGVQWNEGGYFRFPLYIGSQVMGELCGRTAALVPIRIPDSGPRFNQSAIDDICDFFGEISSEWDAVVNGDHLLSNLPLWTVDGKLQIDGEEPKVEIKFEWREQVPPVKFTS